MLKRTGAFLLAVIVAAVLGSVVQSLFNLAALQGIGAQVPLMLWVETILHDLAGFGPLFAAMVSVSLICALPVAALVARMTPSLRAPVFAAAGAAGLWAAFVLANHLAPMPTLIAATRTLPGLITMLACAALGGFIYARCTVQKRVWIN